MKTLMQESGEGGTFVVGCSRDFAEVGASKEGKVYAGLWSAVHGLKVECMYIEYDQSREFLMGEEHTRLSNLAKGRGGEDDRFNRVHRNRIEVASMPAKTVRGSAQGKRPRPSRETTITGRSEDGRHEPHRCFQWGIGDQRKGSG